MTNEKEEQKVEVKINEWDVKVIVWQQCARNPNNMLAVQRHFEKNAGNLGYPNERPDRATLAKIRDELFTLDDELLQTLPPEVQAYELNSYSLRNKLQKKKPR